MPLFPPQDYRKTFYTHRRGTRADQPLASDVLPGTLYYVTDEGITEWSDGTNWETYADTGGGGGGLTNIRVSAGTTSNLLSALTFSNSNGISFGLNASTITASHNGLISQSNQALSAANGSFTFQTAQFHNSNGISFSTTTGSGIIAAHNGLTSQSAQVASADNGSFTFQTLSFSNANNVSFITSAGPAIAASVLSSLSNVNLSAGTTSNNLSNFVFSNSNNVSFGLNGSTITASATVVSTQGSINISAGTTSNLSSNFIFSNSNNVSFGLDGNTITASAGGGGGGVTINYFENIPRTHTLGVFNNSGISAILIMPFLLPGQINASSAIFAISNNFQQAIGNGLSANTTWTIRYLHTYMLNIFTKGSDASVYSLFNYTTFSNALTLDLIAGAAAQSSQYTYTYNLIYPKGSDASTFSATYNLSSSQWRFTTSVLSNFGSMRALELSFGSLSPGNYWIGFANSTTSSNIGGPTNASRLMTQFQLGIIQINSIFRFMGDVDTIQPMFQLGAGSYTTNSQILSVNSFNITELWNSNQSFSLNQILPFQLRG